MELTLNRFLVEGLISVVVGLTTFLVMPASVTETSKIFGGKATWLYGPSGWFTEREEKVLVNRILHDDPSKGDMNNRQAVNLRGIWNAIADYDLWPTYLVGLLYLITWLLPVLTCIQLGITAFIPFQPAANYLSLTLRTLGYSVFEANMLAIPGYFLFFVNVSSLTYTTYAMRLNPFADSCHRLAEREIQRTSFILHRQQHLGATLSDRTCSDPSERQSMDSIQPPFGSQRRALQ